MPAGGYLNQITPPRGYSFCLVVVLIFSERGVEKTKKRLPPAGGLPYNLSINPPAGKLLIVGRKYRFGGDPVRKKNLRRLLRPRACVIPPVETKKVINLKLCAPLNSRRNPKNEISLKISIKSLKKLQNFEILIKPPHLVTV